MNICAKCQSIQQVQRDFIKLKCLPAGRGKVRVTVGSEGSQNFKYNLIKQNMFILPYYQQKNSNILF